MIKNKALQRIGVWDKYIQAAQQYHWSECSLCTSWLRPPRNCSRCSGRTTFLCLHQLPWMWFLHTMDFPTGRTKLCFLSSSHLSAWDDSYDFMFICNKFHLSFSDSTVKYVPLFINLSSNSFIFCVCLPFNIQWMIVEHYSSDNLWSSSFLPCHPQLFWMLFFMWCQEKKEKKTLF